MALTVPPAADRKRVKVYELRNNDWFDRGTGFCTGTVVNDEARIQVTSEDEPERTLLETKITREDGYQKQQETLIVWTDQNVTDMALSFEEAEGCAAIWDFVNESQQRLPLIHGADDGLSDDLLDQHHILSLPYPDMSNLAEIDNTMRMAINSAPTRDALTKYVIANDYISKIAPLVKMAEDFESLADLHRLCSIMKSIILLNDNAIMEMVVRDDTFEHVVGALEYDPDFPGQKANHRKYLSDSTRYKEVVKVQDVTVRQKIHATYRLQYMKDVVLARILDDPTFSVLNSLIFFNQVEIVTHIQSNAPFVRELFAPFTTPKGDELKMRNTVLFIQQCCSIAKGLQLNIRAQLFSNFLGNGLFNVITYALKHPLPNVRVAGTEVLIAVIEHDALLMRSQIFKAVQEKQRPLTDTLIDLLLEETDLSVKAQISEAIKILIDPNTNIQSLEALNRNGNGDVLGRTRNMASQAHESLVQHFYDDAAKKIFKPLKDLENRESMSKITMVEAQLYSHLIDMLCFFVKAHSHRAKFFILSENLPSRVVQLFKCREKHLKLSALKYFRISISSHDPFHYRRLMEDGAIDPILDILLQFMPKDTLLNSACLEFFEHIRREHAKELLLHVVETHREKIETLSYIETFRNMLSKYDQFHNPIDELSFSTVDTEQTPQRPLLLNGQRWQHSLKDMEPEEEAYFNSEENDEDELLSPTAAKPTVNGASPVKPLVDYPEDEDEEQDLPEEAPAVNGSHASKEPSSETEKEDLSSDTAQNSRNETPSPPGRITEKRRRAEEDDDDELGKLSQPKRRASFGNHTPTTSQESTTAQPEPQQSNVSHNLRRKRKITDEKDSAQKKITIAIGSTSEKKEAESKETEES